MKRNEDRTRLPAGFLSALKRVCDREWGLPPTFMDDLKRVYETVEDFAPEELRRLGDTLKKPLEDCRKRLEETLSRLPQDHPILCPVSLYGAMGLGRFETAHTRTLAWLLDPRKEHGFGVALLESLLRAVTGQEGPLPITVQEVRAEYFYRTGRDKGSGRMDVWVKGRWAEGGTQTAGRQWLLVIEAKIDASEGEHQLIAYEKAIKRLYPGIPESEVHRVFLTPKGKDPESAGAHWNSLSFFKMAQIFCSRYDFLRTKPGADFLRLYIAGVLRDILDPPIGRESILHDPFGALSFLTGIGPQEGERT